MLNMSVNKCFQEHFTCIRPADWAGNCSDSERFLELNKQFGQTDSAELETVEEDSAPNNDTPPKENNKVSNAQVISDDSSPKTLLAIPEDSESQSYGIYKLRSPIFHRATSSPASVVELETGTNSGAVIETTTEFVSIPTTTDDTSFESTDIWNLYTESLYDGTTIGDNVEVNAIVLQNSDESTTESVSNKQFFYLKL